MLSVHSTHSWTAGVKWHAPHTELGVQQTYPQQACGMPRLQGVTLLAQPLFWLQQLALLALLFGTRCGLNASMQSCQKTPHAFGQVYMPSQPFMQHDCSLTARRQPEMWS